MSDLERKDQDLDLGFYAAEPMKQLACVLSRSWVEPWTLLVSMLMVSAGL